MAPCLRKLQAFYRQRAPESSICIKDSRAFTNAVPTARAKLGIRVLQNRLRLRDRAAMAQVSHRTGPEVRPRCVRGMLPSFQSLVDESHLLTKVGPLPRAAAVSYMPAYPTS